MDNMFTPVFAGLKGHCPLVQNQIYGNPQDLREPCERQCRIECEDGSTATAEDWRILNCGGKCEEEKEKEEEKGMTEEACRNVYCSDDYLEKYDYTLDYCMNENCF